MRNKLTIINYSWKSDMNYICVHYSRKKLQFKKKGGGGMQRMPTVTNQDLTNLSLCIKVLNISRNSVGSSGEKKPLFI